MPTAALVAAAKNSLDVFRKPLMIVKPFVNMDVHVIPWDPCVMPCEAIGHKLNWGNLPWKVSLTFCQLKKGKIKLSLPSLSLQLCHWLQRARTRLITRILVLMCRELDATVMRAIASLLSGLPLQPEGMETDLDLAEAKSQLFLKLVKLVKICFLCIIKDLQTLILRWRPAISEKSHFSLIPPFWTGFV